MSSNSQKQTERAEPEIGVLATPSRPLRAAAQTEPLPDGRVEVQLRARIAELEARLIELASCLEAAEARAADRLALRAEADRAWESVAMMAESRSWRYTGVLRSFAARVRRLR